ncbi:valine--tRNA ligase [Candidatus Uhrbacteria bacterium]|nr:valine--tRNA ligase [Candidatus Uhrbacteria bacterium]
MAKQDIPKAYEAKEYEDSLYSAWEKSGFFNPDNLSGEPFSIMMPPPNVTGVLHLGHALENTLMDSMIRYQRMRGRKALLLPGTDHAAVATQARVEKNLMEQGIANPREHYGREKLLELIRAYSEESKATILSQIKKLGTSADWSRLAYTFDEQRSRAVNEMFVRMYHDGLIYRGYRVVNWSVKGQSTCSDDELVYVDRASKLYTFKYSKELPFTIATTRPETKLGDTAIAVHPSDERYKQYVGQVFDVEFGGNQLKLHVIEDEHVDPTFGTGALGVTPAHSPIDFEMYERQKALGNDIGLIQVVGVDGLMTQVAGTAYVGKTVEEARELVVAMLREKNLLVSEEEIEQSVGTSDRFGDIVEAIPMTQWFVAVNKEIPGRGKTLKELMKEAVAVGHNGDRDQKVEITPERFENSYYQWIDNLRDWCISRQIWWGHRIPVWYKGAEVFCGEHPPEVQGWTQDADTLDTWFSSGTWTFSTLGWPDTDTDFETFHPTSWMQMGYEILFFWMARMILMSTYALDQIPFKQVYIHGMLRDKNGQKFSKSLGNGIDPLDVIEAYSADALRYSLVTGVTPGNDSRFYEEKVEAAQRLVNKLWNISRFILTSVETIEHGKAFKELTPTTLADRWILSRLVRLEEEVSEHMQTADFSQASEKLREFTWNDFADWYLEASKSQRSDESTKTSTDAILVYVLEHLLTYWHPIMPFVTEQIWSYFVDEELLMAHAWPVMRMIDLDLDAEKEMVQLQALIGAIRTIRSENNVAPKQKVNVVIIGGVVLNEDEERSKFIKALAGVNDLNSADVLGDTINVASTVVGSMQVCVSLEGLVDKEAEQVKLSKQYEETLVYIKSLEGKLANETFVSKAPEHVVAGMKQNLADAQKKALTINEQLTSMGL